MSRPTGNDGCNPIAPAKPEEKDVLSDDSYSNSDDEIASRVEKGQLGLPLDARKRSNRKRLGASGSDTSPKAKSNKPKSLKAMSNEPKTARVTFTLPYRPCDICSMDHPDSRCSYWDYVPQGATVGPGYEVMCGGCCSDFVVDKWHSTDECPEDQVTAATYKFLRERRRQVKALVPVKPSYVPPPPDPDFEPVKPSYVLPHVPGKLSWMMDVDGDVCYPSQSDDIWKRDDVEGLVILDPPDRGSPLAILVPRQSPMKQRLLESLFLCPGLKDHDGVVAFVSCEHHLHYNPNCPYWDRVPQGATVDPGMAMKLFVRDVVVILS
ncbi:hypothetical protein M0R45_010702 [Rubus argutus]|uniref:Uncharacterized protein n=1 Tax=Rubus argutus TaxID=59490 RepID=A0AAW1Y815_RUBAR